MSKKSSKKRTSPASASVSKPEAGLLGPEWVATFSIYWKPLSAKVRSQIIRLAELATQETSAERSICATQQALRKLGMVEVQIIKLILNRYMDHLRLNADQPALHIAAEVLATLRAIEPPHRSKRDK